MKRTVLKRCSKSPAKSTRVTWSVSIPPVRSRSTPLPKRSSAISTMSVSSTITSERFVSSSSHHLVFEHIAYFVRLRPSQRHLVSELELVHDRLSNQARFIQCIIKKEIVLSNRKRAEIVAELRKKDFRPFPKVAKAHIAAAVDENGQEEEDPDAEAGADSDYDYLLSMSLSSLTAEKVSQYTISHVVQLLTLFASFIGRETPRRTRSSPRRTRGSPQA